MAIINLNADVKNLTTGTGLQLTSTANSVNLGLHNAGLAQILSEILTSNSSVTVNYSAATNTISFTATSVSGGSGSGGGSGLPDPLIITHKNQFDANRQITVGLNQDVLILALEDADWENEEYQLVYPTGFPGLHKSLIMTRLGLDTTTASFRAYNVRTDPRLNYLRSESRLSFVVGDADNLTLFGQLDWVSSN